MKVQDCRMLNSSVRKEKLHDMRVMSCGLRPNGQDWSIWKQVTCLDLWHSFFLAQKLASKKNTIPGPQILMLDLDVKYELETVTLQRTNTGEGKSSTQKCQLLGDMGQFPGGYQFFLQFSHKNRSIWNSNQKNCRDMGLFSYIFHVSQGFCWWIFPRGAPSRQCCLGNSHECSTVCKERIEGCFNTPLEHTPKPLPIGCKGNPFIVG